MICRRYAAWYASHYSHPMACAIGYDLPPLCGFNLVECAVSGEKAKTEMTEHHQVDL